MTTRFFQPNGTAIERDECRSCRRYFDALNDADQCADCAYLGAPRTTPKDRRRSRSTDSIEWRGIEVRATVSHDAGCWRTANGDGWPESWEVADFEFYDEHGRRLSREVESILDAQFCEELFEKFTEAASNA